ncbi:hypothetical protein QZH41_013004, partial [Actinostola sp. cb2023]
MPRIKGQRTRRKRPALPEVRSRVEEMKSQVKTIISSITAAYHMELMKIPPHVRKMKLSDFFDLGGRIDATVLEGASKAVTDMANAVFQNAPSNNRVPLEDKTNATMLTPAQSNRKKQRGQKPEVTEPISTGRSLRSTRKRKNVASSPSCKSKTKQQKTENGMPPPATMGRRSTRKNASRINNQFITPACQMRSFPQTPFVTPKFDPSLPVTPALLRDPKAGERIMSMSGSPLANVTTPSHTAQVSVPMGDGKSLQFTSDCHLSPSQVPRLNEQARKNLELLQ